MKCPVGSILGDPKTVWSQLVHWQSLQSLWQTCWRKCQPFLPVSPADSFWAAQITCGYWLFLDKDCCNSKTEWSDACALIKPISCTHSWNMISVSLSICLLWLFFQVKASKLHTTNNEVTKHEVYCDEI